jgi:hypothetical protein
MRQWEGALKAPLIARCSVLTGWCMDSTRQFRPAIRLALDLMFNILELGEDRKPSPIRHATTPPPAPAALALDEIAEYLLHLFSAAELARQAAARLLETIDDHSGRSARGCHYQAFSLNELWMSRGCAGFLVPAAWAITIAWRAGHCHQEGSMR